MSKITLKISEAKLAIKQSLAEKSIIVDEVAFESDAEMTTVDKIFEMERQKLLPRLEDARNAYASHMDEFAIMKLKKSDWGGYNE